MINKYNQTIVVLAFCSAFTDFLIAVPVSMLYPRDRIIHIIISSALFVMIGHILNKIDFSGNFLKNTAVLVLAARLIFVVYGFCEYFRIFYGNNTVGILFFTAVTFVITLKIKDKNISYISSFYILGNLLMMLLIFVFLYADKPLNMCFLDYNFEFSFDKLFVFFDIFTISLISDDHRTKNKNQNMFVLISAGVFIMITLIQGVCIKGNLLYSLSPLQAIIQILSGNTIKRFDYIFNIFFTFNFFGTVILYSTAIKKVLKPGCEFEKN